MGICLSARIKAENPSTGLSSKYVSGSGRDISSTSSKVSSFSAPLTPRSEGEILQSTNLKSFNFADLRLATRNFRPDSVLGEGGFGSVFKGWIDENSLAAAKPGTGIVIAVKRLNQDGFQGHKEWLDLNSNETGNNQSNTSSTPRVRRRSAGDAIGGRSTTAYPRPSASPLYA
ncbi:hypothetical protein CCACVL1_20323 [Corchorus capsularis]|uniref:Protein kinase domain-containing protein n=1 Tax=Corchorus capsularis TaxID=210143 RepID=A0A1R3HBT4_COCAP|nr:hypothetical protein CCACVL1_20323 [Corchorus capsularis]